MTKKKLKKFVIDTKLIRAQRFEVEAETELEAQLMVISFWNKKNDVEITLCIEAEE